VSTPEFDAVILAGGRATRMGGADKPALLVGTEPMVVSVARAAVSAGAGRLIVVGPRRDGPVQEALAAVAVGAAGPTGASAGLRMVREEPPGGGPVAALRAGLAEVTAPWLVLLAADLPFLRGRQLTELLRLALATRRTGALAADADGKPQWLSGGWQTGVLRAALDSYDGNSLHGLLAPLDPALMRATGDGSGPAPWLDCDTPDELAAARQARHPGGPGAGGPGAGSTGAGSTGAGRRLAGGAGAEPIGEA
jgi:molybdenum cofactor guanylyltransferase